MYLTAEERNALSFFPLEGENAKLEMARRNFIGAAYQVVQDPDLISAMTGHVPGSNSFRRYRKVNNEMLRNIIDKM